jgi:hypothetical protein
MNDVEHYNPLFMYRPRRLQKISNALSQMLGTKEEGLPADTPRFLAVEEKEENEKIVLDSETLEKQNHVQNTMEKGE